MSKKEKFDAQEKLLVTTLSRVIEFVKFGEAKNAALFTFVSGWTLALIAILLNADPLPTVWRWCAPAAIMFLCAAGFVALRSFLPKTLDFFHSNPEREKSLIYFHDIALFEPTSYLERMQKRYLPDDDGVFPQSYIDDLTIQISANSKTAQRKFWLFNVAAVLTGIAVAIVLFATIGPAVIDLLRVGSP